MLLDLTELNDRYSIVSLDPSAPFPTWLQLVSETFVSVTRTDAELSVIAPTGLVNMASTLTLRDRSDSWHCLRVETTTFPTETPGIVAAVVQPLADAGLSVFAVASFDTDHLLVQDINRAAEVLSSAGHRVTRAASGSNADHTPQEQTGVSDSSDSSALIAEQLLFRDPVDDDAAGLTVLADAATRRLMSRLWDEGASPGQSSFEVGRDVIRTDTTSLSHLSRWRVVDHNGRLAGGLNSYQLPPTVGSPASAEAAAILQPVTELKTVAEGTWYVSVASVFPEYRGQGIGGMLFVEAERLARLADIDRLTLLVASVNEGAHRLYLRLGFREWQRRAFVPFPGSDQSGDWILMVKDLD